jgi:GNAT superfamily N-acetyltransferase
MNNEVVIRLLDFARDDFGELTDLIQRAYAQYIPSGVVFKAASQDEVTTRRRCAEGVTFVAKLDDLLAGTITLCVAQPDESIAWYSRPGVAYFIQFAVRPEMQGRGIGSLLLRHVEAAARSMGRNELSLDTAETALTLRTWYRNQGFEEVSTTKHPESHHQSIIFSKRLD